MKVKRHERSNTYCGPAALSLITGKHVDKCVEAIHSVYRNDFLSGGRRRPVRGTSRFEMISVLKQFGYQSSKLSIPTFPQRLLTLVGFRYWLRKNGWEPESVYLVNVTGHWLVMKGIKLFDNANPEGIFFGKYGRRRRRVMHAWKVERTVHPVPSASSHQPAV
jgi:hypothetical protein